MPFGLAQKYKIDMIFFSFMSKDLQKAFPADGRARFHWPVPSLHAPEYTSIFMLN